MVALAVRKEPVKVLLPATLWSVVRSRKFWVVDPVPPLATGTMPVSEMLGVCPPLEESGPLAPTVSTPLFAIVTSPVAPLMLMPGFPDATESTPVLLRVSVPPSDNDPPPESPLSVVMVTELFCNAVLGMLLTFAPEIPVRQEPSPENECDA